MSKFLQRENSKAALIDKKSWTERYLCFWVCVLKVAISGNVV